MVLTRLSAVDRRRIWPGGGGGAARLCAGGAGGFDGIGGGGRLALFSAVGVGKDEIESYVEERRASI